VASGRLASITEEQLPIYQLMQNYSNAWYGTDGQLMSLLLSEDFLAIHRNQIGDEIGRLSNSGLVRQTVDGLGIPQDDIYANRIIRDISITEQQATVTLILRKTIHRMKLTMQGRKWQIRSDSFIDKIRS
jgi:hypothetical protein